MIVGVIFKFIIMKKVFFALFASLIFFNFTKASVVSENIYVGNEETSSVMRCFTVTLNLGIASIGTEVCCWRASAHSPKYDCSWGGGSQTNRGHGYIDIETLDPKVKKEINDKKLTVISISNSSSFSDGNIKMKVLDGNYTIQKDEKGRYLKVNIAIE